MRNCILTFYYINYKVNMKLFNRFLLFAIIAISITFGSCKTTKDLSGSEQSGIKYKKLEDALLWKIEGNKLTKPSYLYGTIHIIDSKDFFYPKGTLSAIDNTDKMMFEIDMNEMNDMSKMMGLMSKAFMSEGQTLESLLSEEDYKLVDNHFSKIGLPLTMLQRIKPMFLSVFASGDMDPSGLQSGSMKSYEMEFLEIANESNKPTGGLETIEFQMSVFDSIPYKAQANMLVESIKNSDAGSDEFAEMIKMYTTQRINQMITAIMDEDQDISEFEDILLTKRNAKWISTMEESMATTPTFFAVGAAHLAGENGVIHLLRKVGYKLSPVSNKK